MLRRQEQERAAREHDVAVGDVLGRDAHRALHRAEVAHRLVDRRGRERRVGHEPAPLVGCATEQRDRARELVAGGVGAGHEHGLGQHHQLVGRQPVTFLLDRDQRREEVVARIGAAFGDEFGDVRLELAAGLLDRGEVLGEVLVEDPEDLGGPVREPLPVGARRAEQLADDRDRIRVADVGDEVALAAVLDPVEQLADHVAA